MQLIGAVFLLLWGIRHVRIGFTRAYGEFLRGAIQKGTGNRVFAFFSGAGVTALLQSSMATVMLLTSFARKRMITLAPALAVVLGADVGTTLAAQVLSFKVSALSPIFLIMGIAGRLLYDEQGGRPKHISNICIGLGFMLLSLSLIREASEPLRESQVLPLILQPMQNDFILALLFSALITWVMHSSLAAVLLFASLAASGAVPLELGVLLVLGANIGGAVVPFAATYKEGTAARRITFGNIFMRLVVVVAVLPFLSLIEAAIAGMPGDASRHIVHAHTGFNVLVALVFLPLTPLVARLCERLFPPQKRIKTGNEPLYLDEKALDTPVIALAGAARETLRIAEVVEEMLEKTMQAFERCNPALIDQIRNADKKVDKIYAAIKTYLSRLSQESLDPAEADRYIQILTFSTNLEHIGDIIEKSLIEIAIKKDRRKEEFSEQGLLEIKDFHARVLENMRLAQAIFLSEDSKLAAQLVAKKQDIRMAADATSAKHFRRLRDGVPQTIATSSMHLDIIRDYRRINSYATRVAYAILEYHKPKDGAGAV